MGDVAECLRHQLLASVADDVAQPLVDLQPTAVRSDAGNTDCGVLEGGPEPRPAIAQRLDLLTTLARVLCHLYHKTAFYQHIRIWRAGLTDHVGIYSYISNKYYYTSRRIVVTRWVDALHIQSAEA